ncbi:MAG: DUF1440 domain-containing protein [Cyclobacteriaceae bacterium]|nr:DUF1440 domain-containing protein [Cyclobacteriaceae bacterium]
MALESDDKLYRRRLLRAILQAWLIVGTLDINAAVFQTLMNGRNPLAMLMFISSGVFGDKAFGGFALYPLLGLLFHYIIALIWTVVFFVLYAQLYERVKLHHVWIGALYGLMVWTIMTRIVLPLSNTPPVPFRINSAMVGAGIIIVAIGIPLGLLAHRFFSRQKNMTTEG